jgi:ATP-dependent Lhr-like helicase
LRAWESIAAGRHTLVAAPTGSGKTLAAFLTAINALLDESLTVPECAQRCPKIVYRRSEDEGAGRFEPSTPDAVRVVYVSPLKALSADIHKNLVEPRAGIQPRSRDHERGSNRRRESMRSENEWSY